MTAREDVPALIAEARLAECSECSEEGTSPEMRCDGDLIRRLADALEAAEQRAEEAERERDRLDEAFDRDLPWRYDEVEAQRNELAAVVEKLREGKSE